MRYALSGSALVHVGIFGIALIGFVWPQPDDAPAPGAVTIDIVTMDTVSTNQHSTIQSTASQDMVSAGSVAVRGEPIVPVSPTTVQPSQPDVQTQPSETLEPIPPQEALEPARAETVEPQPAVARAATLLAAAPALVMPEDAVALAPSEPIVAERAPVLETAVETIEPVSIADYNAAPVPQTLSFQRPSEPTQRPRVQQPKPQAVAARASGNGGANNADAAAGKASTGQKGDAGGGGTADIAPWERQLRRALANAQRYPRAAKGATGDVTVHFYVSAAGSLSGLRIVASSGNAALDQAALDTVTRAAPFPPLPQGLGSARHAVRVPLGFTRN